jgi:hypothetical protein
VAPGALDWSRTPGDVTPPDITPLAQFNGSAATMRSKTQRLHSASRSWTAETSELLFERSLEVSEVAIALLELGALTGDELRALLRIKQQRNNPRHERRAPRDSTALLDVGGLLEAREHREHAPGVVQSATLNMDLDGRLEQTQGKRRGIDLFGQELHPRCSLSRAFLVLK